MTVRNFQSPAEVPFQQKIRVPRRSVLCGEDEAFGAVPDVEAERIHNLKRNWNFPNCVLRLRALNLAAPYGPLNAHR
jgi:hypothetical protein